MAYGEGSNRDIMKYTEVDWYLVDNQGSLHVRTSKLHDNILIIQEVEKSIFNY